MQIDNQAKASYLQHAGDTAMQARLAWPMEQLKSFMIWNKMPPSASRDYPHIPVLKRN